MKWRKTIFNIFPFDGMNAVGKYALLVGVMLMKLIYGKPFRLINEAIVN